MFLGLNKGETKFGKILKDGGSALINDAGTYLRSISEERVKQIKAYGGYKYSLEQLLKLERTSIKRAKHISVTSCCEFLNLSKNELLSYQNHTFEAHVLSHHYSHALTAYALSKFEKALVIVWDCGGNFFDESHDNKWWDSRREQHSYYLAEGNSLKKIDSDFEQPNSMGFGEVYRSLTHLLGFKSYIHSSKAMALTSFGNRNRWKDKFVFDFKNGQITSPFKYKSQDNYYYLIEWAKINLNIELKRVKNDQDLKNQDLLDFAAFVQKSMENVAIQKINYLINKYSVSNVCISGGVALNCILNSAIRKNSRVKNLFIPPACGDTGQAIGNAIFSYIIDKAKFPKIENFLYVGSDCKVNRKIKQSLAPFTYYKFSPKQKIKVAAFLINSGYIIGWCQGKSESGPRALGNRSILCRADLPHLEKKLREEIKSRKWYEPFAASVLLEDAQEYFDVKSESPFMLEVSKVRKKHIETLRNCRHLKDGSCRIQTVNSYINPTFYSLLKEYKRISGTAAILNTSLNQRGFPIAENAENAFDFFKTSKLDILFINDYLVIKNSVDIRKSIQEILKTRHFVDKLMAFNFNKSNLMERSDMILK